MFSRWKQMSLICVGKCRKLFLFTNCIPLRSWVVNTSYG